MERRSTIWKTFRRGPPRNRRGLRFGFLHPKCGSYGEGILPHRPAGGRAGRIESHLTDIRPSDPGPLTSSRAETVRGETRIGPPRGLELRELAEIWQRRDLFRALLVRDVAIRYKQTAIGILWVLLQPLLTVAIFSFLLGRVAKVDTGGLPYPLFAFAAMVPWQTFSRALTDGALSVTNNPALVTKVYLPRLLLPAAATAAGLLDALLALVVLLLLMAAFGTAPGWAVLLALPILLWAALVSFAAVLWLSAANALYRDVRFVLPFLAQTWLFLTPVLYPATLVPQGWLWLYALNPMLPVVECFRWAVLDTPPAAAWTLLPGIAVTLVLLVGGLAYFRAMERRFADRI